MMNIMLEYRTAKFICCFYCSHCYDGWFLSVHW